MKKYLSVIIIAVLFGFMSCSEDETVNAPEAVSFSIQADTQASLRSSAPAVAGKDARYIVELWNEAKTSRIGRYVQLNNPSFSLMLDRAVSYNVAVWVDYVNDVDDATPNPADGYYVTTNFQQILLKSSNPFDSRTYQMSELPARDAFTGVFAFTAGQTYPTTLSVKRPFARINVVATDAGAWKSRPEVGGNPVTIRITNPGYYAYNILTQTSLNTSGNVEFTNTINAATYNTFADGQNQTVLSGLYFSNTDVTDNTGNTRNFALHWKVGAGTETDISMTSLPFKRNFITNITGGVIFNTVGFTIDAVSAYDGPDINSPL